MRTTTWIIEQSAPSSRTSGRHLRERIEAHWCAGGERICLDFSSAQAVSEAYADELLGPLVLNHGLKATFSRLRIQAPDPIARVFAVAVRRRLIHHIGAHGAAITVRALARERAAQQSA